MADFIALLLVSLGALLGSGANAEDISRSVARNLLETQPVPVESAEVECTGAEGSSIARMGFELKDMLLDPLMISRASISVSEMVQRPNGQLSIGSISWDAWINDDDLTSALQAHVTKLKDAAVSISEQGITLSGTYPVWRSSIPYVVTGKLVIQNDTQLVFKINRTDLSGMRVPVLLNRLIESEVNPVYDLADFAARNKGEISEAKKQLEYDFHLRIDSIKLGDKLLVVKGGA